ncbi:hypothetical protein ACH4VR_41235 [Streptomyces sp. NPDC020883]|uniref:hypothetical protein n=1 Tax=Streptomyces sp. NPDC020883 TaxID=3365099 RepID=UPI0037BAB058
MSAREIPKLNELVREVGYLRSLLASIPARTDRDSRLKEEYELYVAMLERMMKELVRLAAE